MGRNMTQAQAALCNILTMNKLRNISKKDLTRFEQM